MMFSLFSGRNALSSLKINYIEFHPVKETDSGKRRLLSDPSLILEEIQSLVVQCHTYGLTFFFPQGSFMRLDKLHVNFQSRKVWNYW